MGNGFQEFKFQMKKVLKKTAKHITRLTFPIIAMVLIALIIVGGLGYEMTRQDGAYEEGNMANVPYAATQFTQNVLIDQDGTIRTSMSAQELWDEMRKHNSRIDEYLDGPAELSKLMNAEIVTNYPDTRPEDEIDEPLDDKFWRELNKDVDSTETQGIIKFKRAKDDGTKETMTYVSPEVFQSYIDKYNETGSEADKNTALKHFTIEKQYSAAGMTAGTIAAGTTIEIPDGFGTCYTYMGWQMITSPSSNQYRLREQAGMNFDSEGFGIINGRYVIACTTTFGQVGDYIDFYIDTASGQIVLPCIIGDIKNQNDAGCNQWGHLDGQCVIEFVVDKDSWYNQKENPGTASNHPEWAGKVVKAINGGSYWDNPNFGKDSNIEANGSNSDKKDEDKKDDDDKKDDSSSSSDTLKWPTDGTTITSYFGLRDAPTAGASTDHGAIDIGVPTGTNVYAAKDGTVTIACFDDSAGNMIEIDHGGGFVTRYYHNSQLLVSVGDTVTQGQVIAKSGNTGTSTGPHVHFETRQNGVKVDPLSFKYENGMGTGTGVIGSGDSSDIKTKYVVKVATWSTRYEEVVADGEADPNPVIGYKDGETTYSMTAQTVDYQSMVSGYQMPFDYLWALIVTGRDKDFGLDLADLVYDSEIEITVHDNVTKVTDVDTYEYDRKTKWHTYEIKVDGSWSDTTTTTNPDTGETSTSTSTGEIHEGPHDGGEKEEIKHYKIIRTVKTTTDTLNISLTKADVWMVKYTQEFEFEKNDPTTTTGDPADMEQNREYPDSPDDSNSEDPAGIGEAYENSIRSQYSDKDTVETTMTCKTDYYYGFDGTVTNENTVETMKYNSSPKKIEGKDDPLSDETNFVTLLREREHHDTLTNIMSAPDWLFEMLEENDRTVDLLDLTKYLLYKASGVDYGVTEFDFETFDPANFAKIGLYGTQSGIGGIQGEIYDFFLAKGVPPAGVAAIMGNIEGESSFRTDASNGTHFGLFQWGGGRYDNLKQYASSQGKEWTDLNVQLEFAWQELEGSYSNVKDVLMNTTEESDIEYATWYFGRYFEVFFTGDSFEATKNKTAKRYEYAQKWYKEWEENHLSGGTIYYQGDYANVPYGDSSIAECGCGPTCFAMVASDYTGTQITPADAVAWCGNSYYAPGQGTYWSYFEAAATHFNLPCQVVDLGNNIDAAISQLQSGNLVISSQSAGIFTSGGHFILLSSIENGGIRVRDPNKNNAVNKGYKDRLFTREEIKASGKNYWAFVK
jgi:hypothetical protein